MNYFLSYFSQCVDSITKQSINENLEFICSCMITDFFVPSMYIKSFCCLCLMRLFTTKSCKGKQILEGEIDSHKVYSIIKHKLHYCAMNFDMDKLQQLINQSFSEMELPKNMKENDTTQLVGLFAQINLN